MTEIILESSLDKKQKEALFSLLKSWNIDAQLKTPTIKVRKRKKEFSFSVGIWKDYELSANDIRKQAWKLSK